jgi:hypothetical protein
MPDTHECLMTTCTAQISKHLAFCPAHWRLVPRDLQTEIYETHRLNDRQSWYNAIARARTIIAEQERNSPQAAATVLITGDTYPVKDQLKALGGVWSPAEKGWRVPKAQELAAKVLVGNADNPGALQLPFDDEYAPAYDETAETIGDRRRIGR